MKICVITEFEYASGASIAAMRLADGLSQNGHDIYYVYLWSHDSNGYSEIKRWSLEDTKPEWERYIQALLCRVSNRLGFFSQLFLNSLHLRVLLRRIKPDVINLHNVSSMLSYRAISRLAKQYLVFWTLHDLYAIKSYTYKFANLNGDVMETYPIEQKYINKKARDSMIRAKINLQFIAPSLWLKNIVASTVGNHKTIHSIPNGLSKKEFYPEDRALAQRELNLVEGRFYVLFVASQLRYERKNIRVLLNALPFISELPITILALGKRELELEDKNLVVKYFDPVFSTDMLRKLYSAADVFVIPSLIDNLPNTVLESLFCGTPVVGANVGGIPEMVIPGKTGWLFNPKDSGELADILISLFHNKDILQQIASGCSGWAYEMYSSEKQCERYSELFKKCIT